MPAFDIPNGPLNLQSLFPTLKFRDIEEYYVELKNNADEAVATTTRNFIVNSCDDESMVIFFLNASGGIDSVPACRKKVDNEVKSDRYEKPLSEPHDVTSGGSRKRNIASEDKLLLVVTDYEEKQADWLKELFRSPLHWIGMAGNYVPVVLEDGVFPVVKEEEGYNYHIDLEFTFANADQTQRT
jgi:hypothetical protein